MEKVFLTYKLCLVKDQIETNDIPKSNALLNLTPNITNYDEHNEKVSKVN